MDIQELLQQFLPDIASSPQPGVGQPGIPMPPPRPPQAPQSPSGLATGANYILGGPGQQAPNFSPPSPQPNIPLPPPKPPQIQGQTGSQMGQEVPIYPALQADGMPSGLPSFQGSPMPQRPPPVPPQAAAGVPLPPPRPPSAPQMPQPGQPAPGIPLPPPRPPMPQQATLPPNAAPITGGPPVPGMNPQLTATPKALGPPAPPPFAQRPAPYTMPKVTVPVDKMRQFAAGAGAGLANIQGPGRFASFARGAGQGITGSEKNQQDQEKTGLAAQGQHFNQLSTSFKDMLAARQADNMQAYRDAQAKYLSARADALTSGAGGGSKAWQNTPYGRVLQIEKQVNTEKERATKVLQEQWKQNGTPQDQQNAQLQALDQKYEARRGQLYKATGVDPQQADKIKNMGLSKDNPFDARTMSADQFHSQVPEGAFFINKDGKVYQRNAPPPGQQRSDAAPNHDDQMAMGEDRLPEGASAG